MSVPLGRAAEHPADARAAASGGVFTLAAALVLDLEGRALLVRKRGTHAFMQPGGKIEPGETARQAIVRELAEELTLRVDESDLGHLGHFTADAANEPGWTVDCEVFTLVTDAPVAVAAEIEEARWFDPRDTGDAVIAPLTREHVFPAIPAQRGGGGD
ncbi:NUDIX domain-containing protein [Salinibacterium sp. SYSU T00001]|uniref:NUDIX hydrolase n=1 Tax=Homoserinimonas sedimenticola TaxID=2986805 RepID=UPI002235ABBA|nr:NUDIX domain-containing protein [Salinibacterium sedimenticola]MCW4385425.1 NUDIX domain-containing protein [Salinibacterium sedimenticola]